MVEVKIDMCGHISSPSSLASYQALSSQALRMPDFRGYGIRSIPPFLYFHICFSALAASPFLLKFYHLMKKRHHHRHVYVKFCCLVQDFKCHGTGDRSTLHVQGITFMFRE